MDAIKEDVSKDADTCLYLAARGKGKSKNKENLKQDALLTKYT